MIVQELRHIQERLGWLPKEEMKALAERLGVPLHRVHEVASFYPLYKLSPPKGVEVKVCRDMACHLRGAPRLRQTFRPAADYLISQRHRKPRPSTHGHDPQGRLPGAFKAVRVCVLEVISE